MRIFISYSSRYRELCERLQLALEADGRHRVFVDRAELAAGKPYDETLRNGIEDCDLFLFLVSPESVAAGSYTLAELNMAKARWRHPGGRVLPVKVAPTPLADIPPYLRAVTLLEPQGDVVAETVAAIAAIRPPVRRARVIAGVGFGAILAVVIAAAGYGYWQKQRAADAEVAMLTSAAQQLCEAKNHAVAWQRYEEAVTRYPKRESLRLAREACGMRWLREIRVEAGKETFTDIVNRVTPVLAEGLANASGQRAADLQAHLGWADYLRSRDGVRGMDPPAYYQKALAAEASNVYAHAMWGHYLIARKDVNEAGKQHFAAASASGRDRPFVRVLQFAALVEFGSFAGELEALRAASEMRKNGEAVDDALRQRLWNVYYRRLMLGDWRVQRERFMAAFREADGPATFRWLFPEADVRAERRLQWRFYLASLEQAADERDAALARYQALRADLQRQKASGSMMEATEHAIAQLQRPQ